MRRRPVISSHARFDDQQYWSFSRNSGLPLGYFDRRRIGVDGIVVVVSVACLIVALMVAL